MAAALTSLAVNADDLSADKYSKWNVTLPANEYELTVDINAMTLNVATTGEQPTDPTEPTETHTLYMIGTATGGWAWEENDISMTYDADADVFTFDGHLSTGELKFFTEQSYDKPGIVAYVDASTCHKDELVDMIKGNTYSLATASDGHDHKFSVTEGDYSITVNLNDNTISVAGTSYPAEQQLYMIGTATGGWSWGENDIEMNWNSNDDVYTFSGHLYSGELKFFREQSYDKPGIVAYVDANTCQKDELVNLSKGCTYSLAAASDGHDHKFNVSEGNYSFSVNLRDNTISVDQETTDITSRAVKRMQWSGSTESADAIYSANGSRRSSLGKGINIVYKADGTVMKVVVR